MKILQCVVCIMKINLELIPLRKYQKSVYIAIKFCFDELFGYCSARCPNP